MQPVMHHVFKAALSENTSRFYHKYVQPGASEELNTVPSEDQSVYRAFPFKDQRSAQRVRKDISSLGARSMLT